MGSIGLICFCNSISSATSTMTECCATKKTQFFCKIIVIFVCVSFLTFGSFHCWAMMYWLFLFAFIFGCSSNVCMKNRWIFRCHMVNRLMQWPWPLWALWMSTMITDARFQGCWIFIDLLRYRTVNWILTKCCLVSVLDNEIQQSVWHPETFHQGENNSTWKHPVGGA